MNPAYAELTRRLADLTAMEEAVAILQWDQEIVMPPGAVQARGQQIAAVADFPLDELGATARELIARSKQAARRTQLVRRSPALTAKPSMRHS